MSELLTFKEVIEQANKPHLLLGNGFSIGYDSKRFSFTTLLESAIKEGIIKKGSKIELLFSSLKTADFESIMKSLDESKKVLDVYDEKNILRGKLEEDSKKLKEYLVRIITNNHPALSTDMTDLQRESCKYFLDFFSQGNIYSLNYDLLLYWTFIDMDPIPTDGFGNDKYSKDMAYVIYNQKKFKIHYLHGGLHLFDAGDKIIKKTNVNSGVPLITQVTENLEKNIYPIFISEGDSSQKMTKIMHSSYLSHCYKSFRSITRDIVIFGTYLKSSDEHIMNALLENNIKNIFLGVSKSDSEEVITFKAKIDEFNKGKTEKKKKYLHLYNYKTVNVWDNKSIVNVDEQVDILDF